MAPLVNIGTDACVPGKIDKSNLVTNLHQSKSIEFTSYDLLIMLL